MTTAHLEHEIRNFKRELKEIKSGVINQTKHDKNKIKKQKKQKAVVEIPDVLTKSSSIYKISSHYGISESVARVVKPSMRYFDKNKELINILSHLVDLLPTKTKPRKINSYKDFITYINGYMVFPVPVSAMAYIDFFATNSKHVSTKQVEAFSRLFYGESLKDLIVANFGLSKSEYKYFITSNNTSFNDCYIRSKFYNYNWSAIANHEVSNKIVPTNSHNFSYSYMSGIVSLVKKLLDSKYTLDKISEVMDYIRNMGRFNQVDFDQLLSRSARNIVAECDVWHDTLRMAKVRNNTAWESIGYSCILKESYDENNTLISAMVIDELVNARELATEGRTQSHCVYSYVRYCMTGKTSIVSLRHTNASGIIKPLVTIEIDNNKKHIVQARGKANRQPTQAEKQLIQLFANNKGLVYKV